ncbi:hypothetical protein ACFVIM_03930 [Streptomyces sp. NPDC057638]|uniref:hypothetical protein n=1 Tax=Streptomyces sp. NPDC057638 TaxID=3346190 RepID=UPI0036BDB8A0
MSDVQRLHHGLEQLVLLDDRNGGHRALEKAALSGVGGALDLQRKGSATQRVRQRLYGVAAEFTGKAAWACFDALQFDQARDHVIRAIELSGMSQDGYVQFQIWNVLSMVAHRQGAPAEAVAAAQAAQAIPLCRRDPLVASLAHARTAVAHSGAWDRQLALRSLGRAQEALAKADDAPRPSWLDFYGTAELMGLTAVVQRRFGMAAESEAASHRALAALPGRFRRNRAMVMSGMARAQLSQGDVDLSYETASAVLALMDGTSLPTRLRTALDGYHRDLLRTAPHSVQANEWPDQMRTKGS